MLAGTKDYNLQLAFLDVELQVLSCPDGNDSHDTAACKRKEHCKGHQPAPQRRVALQRHEYGVQQAHQGRMVQNACSDHTLQDQLILHNKRLL